MSVDPNEFDPSDMDEFFGSGAISPKPMSRSSKKTLREAWDLVVDQFGSLPKRADLPDLAVHELALLEKAYKSVEGQFSDYPPDFAVYGAASGLALALVRPRAVPLKRVWGEWLSVSLRAYS